MIVTDVTLSDSAYRGRLFELIPDPICVLEPGGAIRETNPAFDRMIGSAISEISERAFSEFIHQDDQQPAKRALAGLSPEEPAGRLDCGFRFRDGTYRRFSWSLGLDPDSKTIVATGRDLTDANERRESGNNRIDRLSELERDVRFFDGILDSLDDCVYAWNRQEQFVYANRIVEELWGLSVDQYYGKTPKELGYPPELYEVFSEQIARVFATGETVSGEIPYQSPTDMFGYFEYIFTPMFDENGNIELVSGVSRNTTRRRIIEEALRGSEERLRLAIEAADMYSFEVDLSTDTVSWSENAEQLVGFPMPKTTREAFEVPILEDRENVIQAFEQAVDQVGEFEIEYRVEGREPEDELWLFSAGVAIEDGEGPPTRVVGVTQNITERKRADQMLRESQERQAFLLDLSDQMRRLTEPRDIMSVASKELARHLSVSQVGYAEVEEDEETFITGGEFSDGRMPSISGYRSRFGDHGPNLGPALREGKDSYLVNSYLDDSSEPGGTQASRALGIVAGAAIPLMKGDRLAGFLYALDPEPREWPERDRQLLREVAERTREAVERARAEVEREHARQEAEEAVRVRDMFLSIASHELRNPMASIKASAQLLQRALGKSGTSDTREKRLINTLIDASDRLAVLVDDLLDVSRLQSGQLRVSARPVDLAALVRATVNEQRSSLPTYSIYLDVQHGKQQYLDPERTRQVLVNLLDNAAKYSPEGGDIHVRLTHDENGSCLSVQDQGIGLPSDALESIFEPFGRASNASESNIPGMGLGLYICRRLAEAQGGRLWAESQGEGEGAKICLWLPAAIEEHREQPTSRAGGG